MLRIFSLFIAVSGLLLSCAGPYRDTCLFQRSGGIKPIVAVLPVLTSSQNENETCLSWDLSEELTEQIRKRFCESPRIYLLEGTGTKQLAKELNNNNLKALRELYVDNVGASQFVVVTELVRQEETPCKVGGAEAGEAGALLALDFRVRLLDVRSKNPRIVYQELLHHDHFIPRAYLYCDYEKAAWGTESFERTPLGMAHSRLAREVVARVESYIQAARG